MKSFIIKVILGVVISGLILLYLSVPTYNGQHYSNHITRDVRIHREDNGIPHIHASTLQEAYYGLGFTHAQDRLWQLHLRRMTSQGRLAEMFGKSEDAINVDRYIRNLGYLESAQRSAQNYDKVTRDHMQSYADGINDGFAALYVLPIEFQVIGTQFHEWTIYDSVTFSKLISVLNTADFSTEYMKSQFDEMYGRELAKVIGGVGPSNIYDSKMTLIKEEELQSSLYSNETATPIEAKTDINEVKSALPKYFTNFILHKEGGSNGWAISGDHTVSGKPYLANDPHLDNAMPSYWYQAELYFGVQATENYIIGGTLPGLPFTLSGRSKYFGWGLTTLYADTSDIFEEKIQLKNGKYEYQFKEQWLPVRESKEIIKVKNSDSIEVTVLHTHHGPIMETQLQMGIPIQNESRSFSLQAVFQADDLDGPLGIITFQQGSNLKQSLEYMKQITFPNSAMMFVSHDNHIAFLGTGRIVVKGGNPDMGTMIKPGWTGEYEWIRYLTKAEQPMIFDPPKGYIVCANHKYLPDSNKYQLGWNSNPTARGRRLNTIIQQFIDRKQKISLNDVKAMQNDVFDTYAYDTLPILIEIIKKYKVNDGVDRNTIIDHSVKILSQWDGQVDANSNGAALYQVFEYIYSQSFHPELEESIRIPWSMSYTFDSFHFKNIQDLSICPVGDLKRYAPYCQDSTQNDKCIMNIVIALEQAYKYLQNNLGKDSTQWKWSSLHHQQFPHTPMTTTMLNKLFDRRIPYKGNKRTVHVSQVNNDGSFDGVTGANYKMIISMDVDDPNYYIIDSGISGNPFSKHYDDQQQQWALGQYVQMKYGNRKDYTHFLQISPYQIN